MATRRMYMMELHLVVASCLAVILSSLSLAHQPRQVLVTDSQGPLVPERRG